MLKMKDDMNKAAKGTPKNMLRKIMGNSNHLVLLLLLAIGIAHGLYYFPFPLNDGIPASVDLSTHYLRAKLIFDGYGIYDWFHGQFLGTAPFAFYPPLLSFLIFTISKISFGIISFDLSFKICLVLVYAGTPFAVYYALRTLAFDKPFSILAGFLSLYISFFAGFGPDGYFGIGLFANGLAMLLFLPAIAHFDKFMFSEEKNIALKNLIISLALFSLVIATNILVAVFLTLMALLIFLVELLITKRFFLIKRFSVFIIAIPLLTAFWTFPFIYYQYLSGPDANWSGMTILEFGQKFFRGEFFGSTLLLNAAAAIGFLVSLFFLSKERKYRLFLIMSVAGVVLGSVAAFSLPGFLGKVEFALMNRAFSFISFPIAVFAATVLIYPLKALKIKGAYLSLILIIFAVFFATYSHPWLSGKSRFSVTESAYTSPQDGNFRDLMDWIKNNAEGKIVSINGTALGAAFIGLNYTHLDTWVALKTGAYLLDGTYIPQTKNPMKGDVFSNLTNPDYDQTELQKKLETWGVSYFVVGAEAASKLKPELFKKIYSNNTFLVYTISQPGFPKIVRHNSAKNSSIFHASTLGADIVNLPVSYHPNWRIRVNGVATSFAADAENLVHLALPKGDSTIEMKFSMGTIEFLSIALSIFTIVICTYLFSTARKREKLWGFIAPPPSTTPSISILGKNLSSNYLWRHRLALLLTVSLAANIGLLFLYVEQYKAKKIAIELSSLVVADTPYNLTDGNWINGIAIRKAGFFVDNNPVNRAELAPGKKVSFVDGTERIVVKQAQNGSYLDIDLTGPPLDAAKVGHPKKFLVHE